MLSVLNTLKNRVLGKNVKIVFPEANDPRIIEAVNRLAEDNVIIPVVLNAAKDTSFHAKVEVVDMANDARNAAILEAFLTVRAGKLERAEALECMKQPNYYGTLLVLIGEADGLVSGAIHSTGETVRPALQLIKTKPGILRTFGYFLMLKDDLTYVMGDCAINPNPSSDDLASFAIESARAAQMFGIDPKVAMLSYSTNGSANTDDAKKVKEATLKAKQLDPTLAVDGEMQFDAAVVPSVGQAKFPGSTVAGNANVFVFPDLNSGNIGYKMVQRLGGFEAVGPVLAGLNKPVNDLSRGCNSTDVYNLAIITAAQALDA